MFRAALIALALASLNCDMVVDEETDESSDSGSSSKKNSSSDEDEAAGNDEEAASEEEAVDEESSGSGDACETCVGSAVKGACKNAVTECNDSDACNELGACLEKCSDDDCINQCGEDHADGKELYIAANDCIFCGECQEDCDVPADACGGGGGDSGSGDPGSGDPGAGEEPAAGECKTDADCEKGQICVNDPFVGPSCVDGSGGGSSGGEEPPPPVNPFG